MDFLDKSILFISPKFFNYEVEICRYLSKKGASVLFFDDRPSNTSLIKAAVRLNNFASKTIVSIYYFNLLRKVKTKTFDYLLVIKGEAMPLFFLEEIRILNPKAKFIYYTYDSFQNFSKSNEFYQKFEYKYSFEASNIPLNLGFKDRPLFYLEDFERISKLNSNKEIDLLFVGTLHSDRYEILNKLKTDLENHGFRVYFFFYLSGRLQFYYNKVFNKSFKNVIIEDISFRPLTKDDLLQLMSKSKCIIDIEHPSQTGLTMRTIESIGAKIKLITTNRSILNYDLYNKNNTIVIDRFNPIIPYNFLNETYSTIDYTLYRKYSLEKFVFDLFDLSYNE